MGDLVVVAGPPGAGKSTVAVELAGRRDPSAIVEGDAFFRFLRSGSIAPWLPESHRQNEVVTEAAAAAAGRLASGGWWTIFDGVVGPWFVERFLTATGLDRLHYVVLLPSAERCAERVTRRTGHPFNDLAATEHMHRQFAEAMTGRWERHALRDAPDAGAPDAVGALPGDACALPGDVGALADRILDLVARDAVLLRA